MKQRRSNTFKMIVLLMVMCGLYVGYIKLQPYLVAYQSRQSLKNGCYALLRKAHRGPPLESMRESWEKPFINSIRRLGVVIASEDQYEFSYSETPTEKICTGKVAFELTSHWLTLEDAFPEKFPPFRTEHYVNFEHRVKKNY